MTAIVVPETTDAATLVAAHVADNASSAGKLHIKVSESVPHCYIAPDGDDTAGDGRWDRPKATIAAGVGAAPGGRVILSPGTHLPTATIVPNNGSGPDQSGLIIEGAGWAKTIVRSTSLGANPMFNFLGSASLRNYGVTFRDFQIDGSTDGTANTRTATAGIRMKWGERFRTYNMRIRFCNGPGLVIDAGGTCADQEHYSLQADYNAGAGVDATTGTVGGNMLLIGGILNNNDTYGFTSNGTTQSLKRVWLHNNSLFGAKIAGIGNLLQHCLCENNCVGGNPGVWAANTAYTAGQRVLALAESTFATSDCFMVTVGGTSGGTEPTWLTAAPDMASSTTDGGVTWMNVGNGGTNHIGAGIDDTGASRLRVVSPDSLYQGPLLRGNTIYDFPESDLGGTLSTLYGFSGGSSPHSRPGLRMYGTTTAAVALARDDRMTDIDITFSPKGAGIVTFPATNRVGTASTSPRIISGAGSPEAAVTARIGSLYMRTDGGANTSVYVKESGTGNTGWVAK